MLASQHVYKKKNNRKQCGKDYKAAKTKNNTRITALERCVWGGGSGRGAGRGCGGGGAARGGVKALLQPANFTLGPDATLNIEIHKNSVRIKAPNSVNSSKQKHKNQMKHYDKQRRALMANSTVCQSK